MIYLSAIQIHHHNLSFGAKFLSLLVHGHPGEKLSDKSVLLEFSMYPLDKGESLKKYVARSLDIIDRSGIDYRLNPMGTVLEGSWDEVFEVVKKCYDRMSQDCDRISCSIKVDSRIGHSGRLKSKIASVEEGVGRELKK